MQVNLNASYLIKEIIRKQGWIDLPAEGTSMYPLIKRGNICRFVSCEAMKLKKGEIILFQNSSGSLIAHRLLSTKWKDKQVKYLLKGDTNFGLDEAIHYDQIIGKLTSIKKAKYRLRLPSLSVNVWSQMILLFPIISVILRSYLNRSLDRRK
jgi:signal peptidase